MNENVSINANQIYLTNMAFTATEVGYYEEVTDENGDISEKPSLAQSHLRSIICIFKMAAGVRGYTVDWEQRRLNFLLSRIYPIPP